MCDASTQFSFKQESVLYLRKENASHVPKLETITMGRHVLSYTS